PPCPPLPLHGALPILLDHSTPRGSVVIDLEAVPTLDTSGAAALSRAIDRLVRTDVDVWLCALSEEARSLLGPSIETSDRLHLGDSLAEVLRVLARHMEPREPTGSSPPSDYSDGRWQRFIASAEVEEGMLRP